MPHSVLAACHLHGWASLAIRESPQQRDEVLAGKKKAILLGIVKAEGKGTGHQPCVCSHPSFDEV